MSSTQYPQNINPVVDGEAVNAAIDGRPIQQLAQRTDALREVVDDGLFGSAHFAYDKPLESDCAVGMAVYLDDDGTFRKALAGTQVVSGVEKALRSTWACGIVVRKHTSTTGDVLIGGYAPIPAVDFDAVYVGGTVTPGPFFLSADPLKAGWSTLTQPAVGIQLGYVTDIDANGNRTILCAPLPHGLLQSHSHYKFALDMTTSTAEADPGWVAIPSALASTLWPAVTFPTGARFGYNYAADGNMTGLFPAGPLASFYVERNGVGLRLDGSDPECIVNADGIWWTCTGDDPTSNGTVTQSGGCQVPDRIDLWIMKLDGDLSKIYVSELVPTDGSIVLKDPLGNTATTGRLRISATLPTSGDDDAAGHLAFKELDAANGRVLKRGVVLEGIKISSSFASLSGGTAVNEADGDPVSGFKGGRVTISIPNPSSALEDEITILSLDNVDVADESGVHVLKFRQGRLGNIRGSFLVPVDNALSGASLDLEFWVLAKSAGTLPDLSLTWRKQARPSANGIKLNLDVDDDTLTDLSLSTLGAFTANQYTRVLRNIGTVDPGDLVFFTLQRSASDGYAGDLALMTVRYKVTI